MLELCLEVAEKNHSSIALVNDPDADRIQVAELQPEYQDSKYSINCVLFSGKWRAFTGNEMGVILVWWTWLHWKAENKGADLSKVFILNSAVSSQFASTLAKIEGFSHDVALTGFKWIGNLAHKLRAEGNLVILGWEEVNVAVSFLTPLSVNWIYAGNYIRQRWSQCCSDIRRNSQLPTRTSVELVRPTFRDLQDLWVPSN